jgi:hypothetical protein
MPALGLGLGLGLGGAAPTAWSPLQLPGLQLFLTADSGACTDTARTTPATNGQSVAGWTDQSGTGHHASQATGTLCPTLLTGAFPSGKPALVFDGADDYLRADGVAAALCGVSTPISAAALVNPTALTLQDTVWCAGHTSNLVLHWPYMYVGFGHQVNRRDLVPTNAVANHGGTPATGNQRQAWVYNGATDALRLNGGAANSQALVASQDSTFNAFSIGARFQQGAASRWMTGRIGVLVVCNQALSDANMALLDDWLRAWGGL